MIAPDWNAIGTAVAAVVLTVGTMAGGAWAWWQKNQRNQAATRADVAESNAEKTVADAQQTVYKLLVERLAALEKESIAQREDLRAVRTELDAAQSHSRALVLHVWKLEGMMRLAGLTPPPFDIEPPRLAPVASK